MYACSEQKDLRTVRKKKGSKPVPFGKHIVVISVAIRDTVRVRTAE